MKIIAASPLVSPGKGCALRRIVLRAHYEGDKITKLVTHNQYFYTGDITAFGDGNYFTDYGRALQDFYKRSSKEAEFPLATKDELERFQKVV